jgi:hypothetical protein
MERNNEAEKGKEVEVEKERKRYTDDDMLLT